MVAVLQVSSLFCVRFLGNFDLCTSIQSILCGRHCVKSQREQGATLILYNCSPLQDPSGLCIKRTYLSQPVAKTLSLACTKCLVVSIDKLKMRAHIEFLFQVILIWVVFGTMHQFIPCICKVRIKLSMVCSILFDNSCITLIIDQ